MASLNFQESCEKDVSTADPLRGLSKSADGRGARDDIKTHRQNLEDPVDLFCGSNLRNPAVVLSLLGLSQKTVYHAERFYNPLEANLRHRHEFSTNVYAEKDIDKGVV